MMATELPRALDRDVLGDLALAEQVRGLFRTLGTPVEFWEAFCLLKIDRPHLLREIEQLSDLDGIHRLAALDPGLLEKLALLRETMLPLVRDLRRVAARLPLSFDEECREAVIGLLAASAKGWEAISRWIADPDRHAAEAVRRLQALAALVNEYREALERERADPTAPSAAQEARRRRDEIPPGVDLEILWDLRNARRIGELFEESGQRIEPWEIFLLVTQDREGAGAELDHLLRLKREGKTVALTELMRPLRERLLAVRSEFACLASSLRALFDDLPISRFGPRTMDIALGFIMASPRGREAALQWLVQPDHYKREASLRIDGVIGRAVNYERALRVTAD